MRKIGWAIVMAAALGVGAAVSGSAKAAPITAPGIGQLADDLGLVEQAAFIYRGRTHCWYNRGWHGPGWYWCGYATRRGVGWGGPRGWNGWVYGGWGPAVVVAPRGRYHWGGRYWHHRAWRHGRWRYY